jgi:hypothetical protein
MADEGSLGKLASGDGRGELGGANVGAQLYDSADVDGRGRSVTGACDGERSRTSAGGQHRGA